ncbi:MAG: DNA repair protein RecN [Eubacterium sp.]
MIEHIRISDFAIIKSTDVDFQPGLNVITGETGSGKSIIIEAMSLALGARADSSFVRRGADKAKIQMQADLGGKSCIISRELSRNGRNLCRLNGDLVSLSQIQEAAGKIADIHGQYDNQALLDPERHMELVDAFRHEEIRPCFQAFTSAYVNYKAVRGKLNKLLHDERENRRRVNLCRYELQEIDAAQLRVGEDTELNERISVLKNSEKIFQAMSMAQELLNGGEENAENMIGQAEAQITSVSSFSSDLKEISSLLNGISADLQDLNNRIRTVTEKTDFQPGEVDQVISRLDLIDSLKSKYGRSIEEILSYRDRIAGELELVENFEDQKTDLEKKTKAALDVLKEKTASLTAARKKSAEELEAAIERELHDLNFPYAQLQIKIEKAPAISSSGGDICEFLISTNKGEPLKSLAKTASGGEISRIMLAIKNVTGDDDQIPTMIFDEIDTGISGITASVVARKLQQIAKNHQIICITHLPQIAAAADTNYRIYKDSDKDATYSHIQLLNREQKTAEIARLLGGDAVTDLTMKSAEQLISAMEKRRQ